MYYSAALKMVSSLVVLGCLAACSDKALKTPGINYSKSGPIMLNVGSVQVISIPDKHTPHHKHEMKETNLLRSEVETWVQSRFAAQGGTDKAALTIDKVVFREYRNGKSGDRTIADHDSFEGKVAIRLEILGEEGSIKGIVLADVDHTIDVPKTFTFHEREAQLKRLREEIINAIDAKIVKEISHHLVMYMIQ